MHHQGALHEAPYEGMPRACAWASSPHTQMVLYPPPVANHMSLTRGSSMPHAIPRDIESAKAAMESSHVATSCRHLVNGQVATA